MNGTSSNGYHANGESSSTPSSGSPASHGPSQQVTSPEGQQQLRSPRPPSAMTSPCFVHSQLQGASFSDWLKAKQAKQIHDARITIGRNLSGAHPDGTVSDYYEEGDFHVQLDDETSAGSLTKQLAETAVGVREMSKQLGELLCCLPLLSIANAYTGRTRVHSVIQSILIVTKARDNRLIKLTRELALYLMLRRLNGGRGMIVYVDNQLKTSRRFDAAGIERDHPELFAPFPRRRDSGSSVSSTSTLGDPPPVAEGQLRYWTADMCSRTPHLFDFVVTLGGDGTVLFTSWLFQRIVPPVLPFALGSLGFLTNFDFSDHQAVMDNVINNGIRVNLRMRFTCTVYRSVAPDKCAKRRAVKKADTGEILMKNLEKSGWEALENGYYPVKEGKFSSKDKEITCYTTRPVESFEVLNDLVIDRGPSPYVSLLELFADEHHLTTVQADGLTVATPTGSTAYSLSAGGSLVHPEIPAILITPICPHTLSFRPVLLPDSMELRVCVPFNSRSTAWASFDGRGRVELRQGDHIKVTASKYPFPTVCADSQSTDWFHAISRTLKWNERERQKSFVVVEEGPEKPKAKKKQKARVSVSVEEHVRAEHKLQETNEEEDEVSDEELSEEEEEEETFDIDDLSSSESPKSSEGSDESQGVKGVKVVHKQSFLEETIGREKVLEQEYGTQYGPGQAEALAKALAKESLVSTRLRAKQRSARSRSRTKSGESSGVETPDRFAGPHPHPPRVSPRHVQFVSPLQSSPQDIQTTPMVRDSTITRDTVLSPRDNLKTPTLHESHPGRRKGRSRERGDKNVPSDVQHTRRAFAVWGQDESDSAASDCDL
ncbi:unnamed protein product [Somion occarium]|uniref:ATP-NAD kinase n=1 Tax=Somion occarium TaxID=3059160 RepID=A0ABP1DME1_9APHY